MTKKAPSRARFTYENADGSNAFAVDRVHWKNCDAPWVLKDGKPKKAFA
jgi:hypothetical protein